MRTLETLTRLIGCVSRTWCRGSQCCSAMIMKALNAATQASCRISYDFCTRLKSAATFPPLSLSERSDAAPAPRGTIVADHYWTEIYHCAARRMLDPVLLTLNLSVVARAE